MLKFSGWLEAIGVKEVREKAPLAGEEASDDEGDAEKAAAKGTKGKSALADENEEATIPELKEGEALAIVTPPGVITEQKFTQPPPRYSEGSLVRELEDRGIGRPSTYADIISKVQARDYVDKNDGRTFRPTTLGKFVVDGLVSSSLDFIDPAFTSRMEEELDAVEAGKEDRVALLTRFYKRFREQLDHGKAGKRWNPEPEATDEKCATCGEGTMMKRWSKNGWFLGCSNYPKCKTTRDLGPDGTGASAAGQPRDAGVACDKCGLAMMIRGGRYGEFLACSGYPKCKNAKPVPLGVACPKCGGDIIEIRPKKKGGRTFYGCSQWNVETVKCDFKVWQKPIQEPCPACGATFLVQGGTKVKPMITCAKKECGYKRAIPSQPPPADGEGEAGDSE